MGRSTEYNQTDYKESFLDNYYNNWKVYRPFLSKIILHAEGKDVLDIGCGAPYFGLCCAAFGLNYLGVDNADICLDECKKNNLTVIKHNLSCGMPEISKKFDIISFHGIFEHLPLDVDKKLLSESRKYAKPNAVYSLQIPTSDDSNTTEHRKDVHITIKPYSFWEKYLHEIGFEIIDNYNWSFGPMGYYLLKALKGNGPDMIISQMNVLCRLKASRE